jgi:hypothetical protein
MHQRVCVPAHAHRDVNQAPSNVMAIALLAQHSFQHEKCPSPIPRGGGILLQVLSQPLNGCHITRHKIQVPRQEIHALLVIAALKFSLRLVSERQGNALYLARM